MVFKYLFVFLPFTLFAQIGYVEPWGVDQELVQTPEVKKNSPSLSPLGIIATKTIGIHHRFITHISGPRSHYRPSSSQYMLEAIHKYGFVIGYLMGCDRLLRENSEAWVYPTRKVDGIVYKWDPP